MSKKSQKLLTVLTGICMIGAGVTKGKDKKEWETAETALTVVGTLVTLVALFT